MSADPNIPSRQEFEQNARAHDAEGAAAAARIRAREPLAQLFAAQYQVPPLLTEWARRAYLVDGQSPDSLSPLAPYAFAWIAPGGSTAPLMPLSTDRISASAVATPFEPSRLADLSVIVSFDPDALHVAHPAATLDGQLNPGAVVDLPITGTNGHPTPLNRERQTPSRTPLDPLSLSSDPHIKRTQLETYRLTAANPADARVAALLGTYRDLLTAYIFFTGEPLSDWDQLETILIRPINVRHDPVHPALRISWDGNRSYRLEATYPSGLVADTVFFITELVPMRMSTDELPTEARPAPEAGWQVLTAVSPVAVHEATLPLR